MAQLETRAVDLVAAAFALFPDKDYCIITLPHTAPELSLLQVWLSMCVPPTGD